MTPEKFREVVTKQTDLCYGVLNTKELEYSDGKDRLIQFKQAAEIQGIHPLQSLQGMWMKHVTSINIMIKDHVKGKTFPYSQWKEKITDSINYMYLLKALLIDTTSDETTELGKGVRSGRLYENDQSDS